MIGPPIAEIVPPSPLLENRLFVNDMTIPVTPVPLKATSEFASRTVPLDFASFIYDTRLCNFEKDLSILDVLMWNSPDAIVQGIRKNSSLISILSQESGGQRSRVIQR